VVANALQRPTLVLNRNWQPVNVTSVARSLTMVFSGTARVVDPESYQLFDWEDWARLIPQDDEPFVKSVTQRFRVPEVITLIRFDRLPKASVTFSRRNIFKRDKFACQYCGVQPRAEDLTIDHVVPRSQGGQSSWENCVLACVACNHSKADRTPEMAGMRLKKKPARPRWSPAYSRHKMRFESWRKFLSEVYWDAELQE
jgi:5-methylcytosine-specific restriction endonuclease McrA